MMEVPRARAAPMVGRAPWRILQKLACSAGSWVKPAGSSRVSPAQAARAWRSSSRGSAPAAAWNSASRAATPAGSVRMCAGIPGWFSMARRVARSISSRAAAPASRKGMMAVQAARMSGNSRKPVTFTGRSGTVRSTASEMKARVPSEPTSRFRKMSTGRWKSRKALRE